MAARQPFLKMTLMKIDRLPPLYTSIVVLKFGVDIESQSKVRVRKPKIQYGRQAAILKVTSLKINRLLVIYISIVVLKFGVDIESQRKVRVRKPKIQYGRQASILKVTSLKINRFQPIATSDMHMKFKPEIPKQVRVTFRKPCHLQSPETEISNMATRRPFWKWHRWKSIGSCLWPQSTCTWNWNSKANLSCAPETMSPTDGQTDGPTDIRTRWFQYTPLQLRWARV